MALLPNLGHGLGLRPEHYPDILGAWPAVDWFEVLTENYLVAGGNPRRALRAVAERYPVALHGVSMSLGSVDPLDLDHLDAVKRLAGEIGARWISDHLCWSRLRGHSVHDLWPLPLTDEALAHTVARVAQAQERLGQRILVENASSYAMFTEGDMPEGQFLAALAEQADCGILLDVNNVYVSAQNHGFDPVEYIRALPPARVGEIHIAGHSDQGTHLLDTHDHPVCAEVWDLYRIALQHVGPVSSLLERDDDIPPLATLRAELAVAARIAHEVRHGHAG